MNQINTYEAKKNFSALLRKVKAGETIIISSHNKPVAELRAVHNTRKKRPKVGLCAGEFRVPANFNDPLPDDVIDLFYK